MVYEVIDGIYIIKEHVTSNVQQDVKKIKGTVIDESGTPLPFVNVAVKSTTNGVVTDIEGRFDLLVEENDVLIISYIGYMTQEVVVGDRKDLSITLVSNMEDLSEVVVTGYQTISKERATGSFQIVNADDINNVASVSLTDRLQGVTPGVRVDSNTGDIIIRGQSTLDAEKSPLIVVNGIPYLGELSEINTDDIEQMTVLKDAASTSIYGVRGANGVIVITTKNGNTSGRLHVSYNNSFQFGEKARMADLNLLNAKQHGDAEWEIYNTFGLLQFYGYNFKSEIGEVYNRFKENEITEVEAKEKLKSLTAKDNWDEIERLFMQKPFIQKHTVSFNYGTDKNQFYASISYDENKGMWDGNKGSNISFNLNDVFNFNKYLRLNVSAFGNFRKNDLNGNPSLRRGTSDLTNMKPYNHFMDEKGNYINEATGAFDAAKYESFESMGSLPFFYNRLQDRKLSDNETKTSNIATNAKLDVTPTNWLTLSASLGYNVVNGRAENLHDKQSYFVRNFVNRFSAMSPTGLVRHIPNGHILRYEDEYAENLTSRLQLNIKKQIADLYVGFNAGLERNNFKTRRDLNNARYNYHAQRLTENPVDYAEITSGIYSVSGVIERFNSNPRREQSELRYQSMYFIGNATYKEKYDISGSWRLDKTNLFGQSPKYRDQPSWSVGAKWIISEEDFFQVEWINSLALKTSYGLSGNVDRSTSPYLIGLSDNDIFTKEANLNILNPENPLLGWEKTYTTNIGVDYALFDNRINGSIEYYNKQSKDVLALVSLDPTNGFANTKINNGEILNRGFDLAINADIVRKRDFNYNVGLNFAYNYNEITDITINSTTRGHLQEGKPYKNQAVDYLYGYKNAGVDKIGEPLVYGPNGAVSWREMANFDINDGTFFGRKTPPLFGSFIQNFKYKNLSANIFVLYDFGHYVQMYKDRKAETYLSSEAMPDILADRWQNEGDDKKTNVLKFNNGPFGAPDRSSAFWTSDATITKADVIQLKSINLTYDFTSLLNVKAIKSVKLKVGVENLWHWTATENNKIYDRMYTFPRYKNYTMGLSMQF